MSLFKISVRNLLPLLVAVLVGAAFLGAPHRAEANFKIRVSEDGGATYIQEVTDNVAPDMFLTTAGRIAFDYNGTNVKFTLVGGVSKPLFGNTSGFSIMDLSLQGDFLGAGTLTVDITDTGWNAPANFTGPGVLEVRLSGNNSALITGHTGTGYLNSDDPGTVPVDGNVEYGGIDPATGLVFSTPTASGLVGNPSASTNVPGVVGPYSMSMRITLTASGATGFSTDDRITFTPAPGGLVLLLTGLPVLGLGAWLRRRRVPIAA